MQLLHYSEGVIEITPLDTPYLDFLFASPDAFRQHWDRAEQPIEYTEPLPHGLEASSRCERCKGSGEGRRRRTRSDDPETRKRRERWRRAAGGCSSCNRAGYVALDAKPGAPGFGGGSRRAAGGEAEPIVEAAASFEFVPEAELRRNRARRLLDFELSQVAEAWARRFDASGARTTHLPLTTIWPLTPSGRRAHVAHLNGVTREGLLQAANREASALLARAEARAQAACHVLFQGLWRRWIAQWVGAFERDFPLSMGAQVARR